MAVGELPQELTERGRAYTPAEMHAMPPDRSTSKSSMQSAPAAIPPMIEVSFPTGFTPAERTRVVPILTFEAINSNRPAASARPITGASPACDRRCSVVKGQLRTGPLLR